MNPFQRCAFPVLALLVGLPTIGLAADKTCDAVNKAGALGVKQTRIHYAADLMRPVVPRASDKPGAIGEELVHSITVDNTNFMALNGTAFLNEPVKDGEGRSMASGMAVFQYIDEGYRSLGKSTLAGRAVLVFEQGGTKTTEDRLYKFWIDAQTGLPVRSVEDTVRSDISSFTASAAGRPKIDVKGSNKNERIINTIAFVYGDVVKAPKLSGAKGLLGQKGELDATAVSALKAIIKGQ